jgi:CPA1 family monovalent cation:H+ antiporter
MEDVLLGILAVSFLLLFASLAVPLADRLRIPHAVLLAAIGMGAGLLTAVVGDMAGMGAGTDIIKGFAHLGVEAEALIALFLPALLFTVGIHIDVRRLIDELGAVLLLAVVAVVLCTIFVGIALSWFAAVPVVACFLLGALVATTDPAAVIAVFRDLGAPRRLTILVQGESLFNDAAAIAMFAIFADILLGVRQAGLGEGVAVFLRDFLGGALLGYALGRAACWVMKHLAGEVAAQITVTVALAYLAFALGDEYLHVSGIVAVAVASLVVAAQGPVVLGPREWKSLVEVWHQLEFWCNSLIFVLAALLAGRLLGELVWRDLALLAVLVGGAVLSRAVVLFGLLPGLRVARLVQPVDGRYKAVVLWGGLRGAVTLTLALAVANNPAMPEEVRHMVGVLATGFVLFTLFVSAPTLRPLLRMLGLDRLDPVEAALRDRVMALSQSSLRDDIRRFAEDSGLDPSLCDRMGAAAAGEARLGHGDAVRVGLLALAAREKGLYLDRVLERAASRRLVALLSSAADRLLDRAKTGGVEGYETGASELIGYGRDFRVAHWLYRRFGLRGPLGRRIADRFETLLVVQLVLRELTGAIEDGLRALLGDGAADRLKQLLDARREGVRAALAAIELQYPRYAEQLRAQYVARGALRLEAADYEQKLEQALISREVHQDLIQDVGHRGAALDRRPELDLGLRLSEMIGRVPAFAGLPKDGVAEIARLLRPRLAIPGERVIRKGDRGREMYFLVGGAVDVRLPQGVVRLETGAYFGEMAILDDLPRSADVDAAAFCTFLVLDARDFQRLLRAHPEFEVHVRRTAEERRATSLAEEA